MSDVNQLKLCEDTVRTYRIQNQTAEAERDAAEAKLAKIADLLSHPTPRQGPYAHNTLVEIRHIINDES